MARWICSRNRIGPRVANCVGGHVPELALHCRATGGNAARTPLVLASAGFIRPLEYKAFRSEVGEHPSECPLESVPPLPVVPPSYPLPDACVSLYFVFLPHSKPYFKP